MTGRERNTRVRATCAIDDRRRWVRELNDGLRRYARTGVICVTAGVHAMGPAGVEAALTATAVRDFDCFTAENAPYGEHDFGALRPLGSAGSGRSTTMIEIVVVDHPTPPTQPSRRGF